MTSYLSGLFVTADRLWLSNFPDGKIGIYIGSHKCFNEKELSAIDTFCAVNNAVAFCDHTSGYKGRFRVDYSIIGGQEEFNDRFTDWDLMIHIGEVSGDYYSSSSCGSVKAVWRVSEDGELRDTFGKLTAVFEMKERARNVIHASRFRQFQQYVV